MLAGAATACALQSLKPTISNSPPSPHIHRRQPLSSRRLAAGQVVLDEDLLSLGPSPAACLLGAQILACLVPPLTLTLQAGGPGQTAPHAQTTKAASS